MLEHYIGTKEVMAAPQYKIQGIYSAGEESPTKEDINNALPGYRVVYPDGYISWCPKEEFEKAYRKADGVSFGLALEAAKRGKGFRLPDWKPDVVIRAQFPDENSKMTAPYLYVESRFGRVPWKETMIELFSDKWQIVE